MQALAETDAELVPATPREIVTLLGQLTVVLPMQKLDEAQEKQRFATYIKDLAHFPVAVLEAAIAKHRQTEKWFPTPSEIIKHADPDYARLVRRRDNLRLRLKPREEDNRPDLETRRKLVAEVRKEFHLPQRRQPHECD